MIVNIIVYQASLMTWSRLCGLPRCSVKTLQSWSDLEDDLRRLMALLIHLVSDRLQFMHDYALTNRVHTAQVAPLRSFINSRFSAVFVHLNIKFTELSDALKCHLTVSLLDRPCTAYQRHLRHCQQLKLNVDADLCAFSSCTIIIRLLLFIIYIIFGC